MQPLEVRRYEVCRAIAIHLRTVGSHSWRMVRVRFAELAPATFWRCVKRVIELPEADRYSLARGQRPVAEPARQPPSYPPRPFRITANWNKKAEATLRAINERDRPAPPEIQLQPEASPAPAHRKKEAAWPTIGQLVPVYAMQVLSKHRRGASEHRSLLRVCEPLRDRRWVDVVAEDLEPLIEEIARDAPVHANRVRAYYSAFCAWGIENGHTNYNPIVDVGRTVQAPRTERTHSLSEIAEIWHAADTLGRPFGPAIQLLIVTAARRGNVDGMRKSEVARGGAHGITWTLTNHRRGGARQFTIPLAPLAQEVLARVLRASPPASDLVFTTTGSTPISGWSRAKRDLDGIIRSRRLQGGAEGDMAPWRLDDLRRSFVRASLDHLDGDREVLNRCLDLKVDVSGRFGSMWGSSYYEIEPRRAALFAWADLLAKVVG